MTLTKLDHLSSFRQAAVGFALGAVGGFILGATEDPVDQILSKITTGLSVKPVMDNVMTMGPLGLGTLTGATVLTTAMTSVIAGVIVAAVVASVFVATRNCGASHGHSIGLLASAGLAGTFGTTLSGATFGVVIEGIVKNYGMAGLLWALSIFTVLKPLMCVVFTLLWKQGEACCTMASEHWAREREKLEMRELQQRLRVTVQIMQRILTLGKESDEDGMDHMTTWATELREREEIERKKKENEEAEMDQRTIQAWINIVMVKNMDLLAFSGIPMTVLTLVISGFGFFGSGHHQSVSIAVLALAAAIVCSLMKSSEFKFWMLVGCVGMLQTSFIAMLTLQAGQEALTAGQSPSPEATRANLLLNAAAFEARLYQLCLGATVGGTLIRQDAREVKVIAGAAVVAGSLLTGVEVLGPVVGDGGTAGALLGVVGAVGVSVGAAEEMAIRWSSWPGTLGTMAGLVVGVLVVGKQHFVNIGLQLPVAFIFARTNPF